MEGRLLVVAADSSTRDQLARALGRAGFAVEEADVLADPVATVRSASPDLVLLSGDRAALEACRALRATGATTPIVIVGGTDVGARVDGLDAGADDVVDAPAPAELVARVRACLRRARVRGPRPSTRRYTDLALDAERREVTRAGRRIRLTRREFDLLALFMAHPEAVLSRERLLADVWQVSPRTPTNAVDVYVGYLRRKLEEGDRPRLIWTVRGAGYVLRERP